MQWFYARGPDATQQMATELFAKHVMVKQPWFPVTHRIHGAAIYGNIYHQYTPNVSIYHTWILWIRIPNQINPMMVGVSVFL